jgi:hypothetical protein
MFGLANSWAAVVLLEIYWEQHLWDTLLLLVRYPAIALW